MLAWKDLRPGFYRGAHDRGVGLRVDTVHGHLDGDPVVDAAWLEASPLGWRVVAVEQWAVLRHQWAFEPMDPPR